MHVYVCVGVYMQICVYWHWYSVNVNLCFVATCKRHFGRLLLNKLIDWLTRKPFNDGISNLSTGARSDINTVFTAKSTELLRVYLQGDDLWKWSTIRAVWSGVAKCELHDLFLHVVTADMIKSPNLLAADLWGTARGQVPKCPVTGQAIDTIQCQNWRFQVLFNWHTITAL